MQSFASLKKVVKNKKIDKPKKKIRTIKLSKMTVEISLYDWYITSNCETFLEI